MNTSSVLLASVLLSTATSLAVQLLVPRSTNEPADGVRPTESVTGMPGEPSGALADEQARMRADLEALAGDVENLSITLARSPLRQDSLASVSAEDVEVGAASPLPAPAASAHDLLERLLAADEEQSALIWQEAREAGKTDELIALMEERSAEAPRDPDRKLDVGLAYLAKIDEVGGGGPLAGEWATKADHAFDAALEIDPEHWEARFTKAVALSFWPPVFGRKAAAIQHFETLRSQQAGRAAEPHYSQTYLLLGNLYRELGEVEKARAVWSEGLTLFPGDEELAEQVSWSGI